MAQYADSVRPGAERASVLGSPDVRLHLPKHWAIASWVTEQGRAQPFVAQTIPLRTDPQRIARHHAAQAARGGRVLERFHQPHWDRELEEVAEDVLPPTTSVAAVRAPMGTESPSTSVAKGQEPAAGEAEGQPTGEAPGPP